MTGRLCAAGQVAGEAFAMRRAYVACAGIAGLHPDRNFDTIASLAREVGFGAAFARLTMGARCAVLAGGAAERLAELLADEPRAAALGWDVRRTMHLDDAGRLRVEPLRAWLAQTPVARAGGGEPFLRVVVNDGAGPYLCRPLQMGADLVVEDARLWAGGRLLEAAGCGTGPCLIVVARSERAWSQWAASCPPDVLPGAPSDVLPDVRQEAQPEAPAMDGRALGDALAEALGTLSLVCQRRSDTALVVAHYVAACPHVAWVSYPGLTDDPANEAARRTLEHGFGARVAFGVAFGVAPDATPDATRGDVPVDDGRDCDCATSWLERVSPTEYVLHAGLESALDVVGWIDRFLKGAGGAVE